MSESGVNSIAIKQLRRRRSDIIAQSYIDAIILNKELIFDEIVQKTAAKKNSRQPSNALQVPANDFSRSSTLKKIFGAPSEKFRGP